VANDFNPLKELGGRPSTQQSREAIGISVEDVAGFIALARDRAGLGPEGMTAAFSILANQVHPLALGNVHRQSLLIRSVARRLLELHLDAAADGDRMSRIVDVLTEKLYYHGYHISRYEAERVIGLPVARPTPAVEAAMWALYLAYRRALHLDALALNGPFKLTSGIIESGHARHVFEYVGTASRAGANLDVNISSQEWRRGI